MKKLLVIGSIVGTVTDPSGAAIAYSGRCQRLAPGAIILSAFVGAACESESRCDVATLLNT